MPAKKNFIGREWTGIMCPRDNWALEFVCIRGPHRMSGAKRFRPRMDTDAHEWESDLTEVVIGAAFEVSNELGAGFLEKVYERAPSRLSVALLINFQRPKAEWKRVLLDR